MLLFERSESHPKRRYLQNNGLKEANGLQRKRKRKMKTVSCVGKVMASLFCYMRGIIFVDYFEKGEILNDDIMQTNCSIQVPALAKTKVLFHHDGTSVHTSVISMPIYQ